MVKLWWKVERPKARVLRLAHRPEGIYPWHYWVAAGEAPPTDPSTEMGTLREAGVLDAYRAYEKDYEATKHREREVPRLPLTYDEWELKVKEAHRELRDHFGAERLAVILPADDPTLAQLFLRGVNTLPLFAFLCTIAQMTIAQTLLKKMGLPYTCLPYMLLNAEQAGATRVLRFLFPDPEEVAEGGEEEEEGETPEQERLHTLFGDRAPDNVAHAPIPYIVIDPRSGKPIQVNDYLKSHLGDLKGNMRHFAYRTVVFMHSEINNDLSSYWRPYLSGLNAQLLSDYSLLLPAHRWTEVIDWLRERPQALKTLLSFMMPTGDRNLALFGIYTVLRAMTDYTHFIRQQPNLDDLTATQILDYLKGRIEYWVEKDKEQFGFKGVPISAEKVWAVGWEALRKLRRLELAEDAKEPAGLSLLGLVNLGAWEVYGDQATAILKSIAPVLINEELTDPDLPTRLSQLRKLVKIAQNWFGVLADMGHAYLVEHKDEIPFRSQDFYNLDFLQEVANKSVARYHNELNHIVRAILKTEDLMPARQLLGRKGAVAVVDFSPLGFYTLTKDDTCFGRGNIHHPHILGLMKNSAVVRFFAQGRDLGRMWGFIDPENGVVYLTNRVGKLNKTVLRNWGVAVAATLLGTSPDKVTVDTFGASSDLSDLLYAKLDHLRDTMGLGVRERPYLNQDAIKVSVKG
jgi:hypothetical protein